MARPREFDRDEALDRAVRVFWKKGFDRASMQDLVDAMGIGRASLYDTFGSKEALFTQAMDRYAQNMEEELLTPLRQKGPALKRLEEFFSRALDSLESAEQPCCLMIKAAVGLGSSDPAIAERVSRFFGRYEDALVALLSRARDSGEIQSGANPRSHARFLRTLMHGLSVNASLGQSRRGMRDVLKTTLNLIK